MLCIINIDFIMSWRVGGGVFLLGKGTIREVKRTIVVNFLLRRGYIE